MRTDIAFSYLVARLIFGARHPAIPFLLLLAIADDALGLAILAVFYPTGSLRLMEFVALLGAAVGLAAWLRSRVRRSFWPYILVPGVVSWLAFFRGGLHPALALRADHAVPATCAPGCRSICRRARTRFAYEL